MPWFRIDDSFHCHPKVMEAGTAAAGLWVRCGCYSAQHLTDGFVPASIAAMYGTPRMASRLVSAGLWSENVNGFTMKDFSDYNPSRADVEKERSAARERMRARRSGEVRANTDRSSDDVRGPRPDPTRNRTTTTPNGVVDAPQKRTRQKTEATRLDDWLPSPADVEWARAEGLPDEWVREQTARFRDYWIAVPGAKGRKADWPATWRNWLRRDADKIPARSSTSATSKAVGWLTIDDQPNLRAIDGGSK